MLEISIPAEKYEQKQSEDLKFYPADSGGGPHAVGSLGTRLYFSI